MAYAAGIVPGQYDPGFLSRELRRIQDAFNFEEGIGNLSLDPELSPVPSNITTVPTKLPIWHLRGPNPDLSDGPIKTDPRVSPAAEIEILTAGIYQVGYFITFEHQFAVEVFYEFYINDVRTFFFDGLDAANQQDIASVGAVAQVILQAGDVLDVRAFTLVGDDDVSYVSGEFYVHKLRDLRTRFN